MYHRYSQPQSARNQAWDVLKGYLNDDNGFRYRNLYLNAHGSPKLVGGDWEILVAGKSAAEAVRSQRAYLTVKQVRNLLRPGADYRRAYRFAFLDGCETARGGFPEAFCGEILPDRECGEAFFKDEQGNWLARPRAFLGWTEKPSFGGWNLGGKGVHKGYVEFRLRLLAGFSSGQTLAQAIRDAANAVNNKPEFRWESEDFFGNPETITVWDKGLIIMGNRDMKIEEFNRQRLDDN